MPDNSQAIALRTVVAHDLAIVQKFLVEVRDKAHILTPFARSNVPMIPNGWDVYFHQYKISTRSEKDAKGYTIYPDQEVYNIQGTPRLALTKIGLWRLEQLAGVTWEDPRTGVSTVRRTDDGKDMYVCRYQATGYIRDIDGQIRSASDGFGYDLRDGSPQALAKTEKELPKVRQNIEQLTITKCKLRVLRSLLGIQSSYTIADLEKPFIVLKMQFNIDKIDPEIKKKLDTIMAAKQMGIEKELFGLMQVEAESMRRLTESITEPPAALPPVSGPVDLPGVVDPVTGEYEDPDEIEQKKYWAEREALVKSIEVLYLAKKGTTREILSPTKPPLTGLNDSDLTEIEKALSALPDLQKKDIL
jgi:hypothetical protein